MANLIMDVSVVVTYYFGYRWFRECIQSILDQTRHELIREIIVIIDGSAEEDLALLNSFVDRRIRIVTNSQHLGIAGSKNVGTRLATSSWVAYMDQDDIWEPRRLEVAVAAVLPGDVAIVNGAKFIDENGRVIGRCALGRAEYLNSLDRDEQVFRIFRDYPVPTSSAVMFHRQTALNAGLPPLDMVSGDEILLVSRLAKIGHVRFIDDTLTKHRVHALSASVDIERQSQGEAQLIQIMVQDSPFLKPIEHWKNVRRLRNAAVVSLCARSYRQARNQARICFAQGGWRDVRTLASLVAIELGPVGRRLLLWVRFSGLRL